VKDGLFNGKLIDNSIQVNKCFFLNNVFQFFNWIIKKPMFKTISIIN